MFILWKVLRFFMSNIKCMYVNIVFLIERLEIYQIPREYLQLSNEMLRVYPN